MEAVDEFSVPERSATLPGFSQENTMSTMLQLTQEKRRSPLDKTDVDDDSSATPLVFAAPQEFTIEVTKGPGKIALEVECSGEALLVTNLKPGIVMNWNTAHPKEQVEVGDLITAINGVVGVYGVKFLAASKEGEKIFLRVCKSACFSA